MRLVRAILESKSTDGGAAYFIRPGREMLFGIVDNETRYKVKNLIDVSIYRGGDALSSQA